MKAPIPLVLDTNILIAAAYAPQSASHRIVQACLEGRCQLVVSEPLQREYERMVGQAVRAGQFDEKLAALLNASRRVQAAVHEHHVPADPDDAKVLATAVAVQVRAIVTNDQQIARQRGLKLLIPIAVPLRETDQDVPLDLQRLIDQCYRNGGYDDDLDYRRPPDPPLEPDDESWADALLRNQGRR